MIPISAFKTTSRHKKNNNTSDLVDGLHKRKRLCNSSSDNDTLQELPQNNPIEPLCTTQEKNSTTLQTISAEDILQNWLKGSTSMYDKDDYSSQEQTINSNHGSASSATDYFDDNVASVSSSVDPSVYDYDTDILFVLGIDMMYFKHQLPKQQHQQRILTTNNTVTPDHTHDCDNNTYCSKCTRACYNPNVVSIKYWTSNMIELWLCRKPVLSLSMNHHNNNDTDNPYLQCITHYRRTGIEARSYEFLCTFRKVSHHLKPTTDNAAAAAAAATKSKKVLWIKAQILMKWKAYLNMLVNEYKWKWKVMETIYDEDYVKLVTSLPPELSKECYKILGWTTSNSINHSHNNGINHNTKDENKDYTVYPIEMVKVLYQLYYHK